MKRELRQAGIKLAREPSNHEVRNSFFHMNKQYKKLVKKKRREFRNKILHQMLMMKDTNPQAYWKLLEQLKQTEHSHVDPADNVSPNEWVSFFSNLYNDKGSGSSEVSNEINKMELEPWFNELNFAITEEELQTAAKKLKNHKAPGLDGVSNEMITASLPAISHLLNRLFNKILTSGEYPSVWSTGYIKPLFKTGTTTDPNNYRAITICNSLGKLFSIILNNRLNAYIGKHHIMCDNQIGFQKNSRTADHIFVLKTAIDKYLKLNKRLFLCFVDFHKAFDSVWREGLWYKVLRYGIRGNLYRVIKNMYKESACQVKSGNALTSTFQTSLGVMQGEVLSPTLFNLYVNDIPQALEQHDPKPVHIGDKEISCLMYADDVVLLSVTQEGLQNSINALYSYCHTWRLKVNIAKTKVIICNKSNHTLKQKFSYGNVTIENVNSYKYLGVIISANGSFHNAEHDLYRRALRASFKIKGLLSGTQVLPNIQLDLFNKIVKPVCLYGSEVWGLCVGKADKLMQNMETTIIEKVQMSFGKAVLQVNKKASHTAIRGELGLFPMRIDAITHAVKYHNHLVNQPDNSLLKASLNDNIKEKLEWFCSLKNLRHKFDIQKENSTVDTYLLSKSLKNSYESHWHTSLSRTQNNKLDSYALYKRAIKQEPYLSCVTNSQARQALGKMRISAHKLRIETGRYESPKLPRDQRVCIKCPKIIEDEIHVITQCDLYKKHRDELYRTVTKDVPNFNNLNEKNKFIYLMSCENEKILNLLAKFACFILSTKMLN